MSMEIKDIYSWGDKSLEDLTLNELSELDFILRCIPKGVEKKIVVNGKEYRFLHEYINERTEAFFSPTREDYENIVGKCFIDERKNVALKVMGLSKDDREFLYELFEKHGDGTWHLPDYNWLQDMVKDGGKWFDEYREEYRSYCISPYTDMNIMSEEMFYLGKDGNLYIDYSCGGDYYVYTPIKETTFQLIREEAIENDGEL